MDKEINVLSDAHMRQMYGGFFERSPKVSVDKDRVPSELWPLIPYAEFWGIADDWAREDLVQQAPEEVKENLKAVLNAFNAALDVWLAGPEADLPTPSREYIAFSAMRMASDFI